MKSIFFDLDTDALLSKDGRARPFMDIILKYCASNKVDVYLAVSANGLDRADIACKLFTSPLLTFRKGGPIPVQPNLVISSDSDYLKKWPGLLVPPYVPERSNEFMELAFAGTLLETIKNRVVLERAPAVQSTDSKPQPPPEKTKEDFSNWAFEV